MKINSKIPKILLVTLVACGITFHIASCKKDSTASGSATITEADAAELATNAVSPSAGGMVAQLNSSATIYSNGKAICGGERDSTVVYTSVAGASPSYSYSLNLDYTLTCSGLAPSQLTLNYSGTGSYDGPRMASTDNSIGGFALTGLQTSSPQYFFNSRYERDGNSTSKIANQYKFSSIVQIIGTNIAVDKTSMQITSGSAAVSVTAVSSSGKSFSFTGNITFLGNKKGTLVLNSGTTYAIQW